MKVKYADGRVEELQLPYVLMFNDNELTCIKDMDEDSRKIIIYNSEITSQEVAKDLLMDSKLDYYKMEALEA